MVNTWTFAAFGGVWSAWFLLIHCEFSHPWDPAFEKLGLGTAAFHNRHHALLRCNYGHIFQWWDVIGRTLEGTKH